MEVLLRSVESVENSLPVLYFDLDESQGSISAMNGDPTHQTECYGDVKTLKFLRDMRANTEAKTRLKPMIWNTSAAAQSVMRMRDKKPYKVKLDKKADLFGMGSNKHYPGKSI